jgi:lysophospholipase L1-like esterase
MSKYIIPASTVPGEAPYVFDAATGKSVGLQGTGSTGVTPFSKPSRNFTGRLPYVLSPAPTLLLSNADEAAMFATGPYYSVLDASAFKLTGCVPQRAMWYPDYQGLNGNMMYSVTAPSPWAVEFWLDTIDATGRFEIAMKGAGNGFRVGIRQPRDAAWGYASTGATFRPTGNGETFHGVVAIGAPGTYQVRIEMEQWSALYGVGGPAGTHITALPRAPRTYIVVGDSFTEPTVVDSIAHVANDGWVSMLEHITGYNFISAGLGGTGYLGTNNGTRPKYRDRLMEAMAYGADGIIFTGGVNDIGTFNGAQIGPEATACFEYARNVLGSTADIVVVSPFYPRQIHDITIPNLLDVRDALRTACAKVGGTFLDVLSLPTGPYFAKPAMQLLGALGPGNTSIDVAVVPHAAEIGGFYLCIGEGPSAEIRKVTGVINNGSSYTLNLNAGVTLSHAAGAPVTLAGPSYMTGTGNAGAHANDGIADYHTSADGMHPTIAGHRNIARTIATLWANS